MLGKRAIDAAIGSGGGGGVAPTRSATLLTSIRCAREGLRWALGSQRNLRLQVGVGVFTLALLPSVPLSTVEAALLIAAVAAVLVAELFNTAAEALVDLACPEVHPLAKVVKDVAAAGVLVTAAGAAAIGVVILWPHVRSLF